MDIQKGPLSLKILTTFISCFVSVHSCRVYRSCNDSHMTTSVRRSFCSMQYMQSTLSPSRPELISNSLTGSRDGSRGRGRRYIRFEALSGKLQGNLVREKLQLTR